MTELKRLFDRARDASEKRGIIVGYLGRINPDATVTITVANRPTFVYVRIGTPGGQATTIAKNTANVATRANLPVDMRRDEGGQLVIIGINNALASAATAADPPNTFGVPYHVHRIGTGLEYQIEALRMEPGLVRRVPAALVVVVDGFRYRHGAVWKTFVADSIDLSTTHQPATAGDWRWVLIGVSPITNTLVAVSGPDVTYATPLTVDLLDAIDFDNYIPCGAVRVRADGAALTDASLADARIWLTGPQPALDDLLDVTITTPAASHVLAYDDVAAEWANRQLEAADILLLADAILSEVAAMMADTATINITYTAGVLTYDVATAALMSIHDGVGGWLNGSKTIVDTTPQIIIPDGTGDVTAILSGSVLILCSGAVTELVISQVPGGSQTSASVGSSTFTLATAAGGEVSVFRASGANTATVVYRLYWI